MAAPPALRRTATAPSARTPADVETALWRALAVFRIVVLGFAVAVAFASWDELRRPAVAAAVLGVMTVWTVVQPLLVARARTTSRAGEVPRALTAVLAADLALAVGMILLTPLAQSPEQLARHSFTLPSYWVAAAVLGWAVAYGWRGGLAAGAVVAVTDLAIRDTYTGSTVSNVFLLLAAGGLIGYVVELVRVAAAARAQAVEMAAVTAERERLARAVHDGVLQVLALVQRRGGELGGEVAELGRLAGEQEESLRALLRSRGEPADEASAAGHLLDLTRLLEPMSSSTVSVAGPGAPVPLPVPVARELAAAVEEALGNVSRHCPPGTRAWVLVEDLPGEVVVSVRDDGPGIPDGRLAAAVAEGRLGVDRSIRGRLADLGGRADLSTGAGGTEWELRVPG
jgi:signal transduction histidine kinase